MVDARPPRGTCLNANIPALDAGWPQGIRCCPQGTTPWVEAYRRQDAAEGRTVYWLDGYMPPIDKDGDSDEAQIANRYVTITPLRFNLTDSDALRLVTGWNWPDSFA